MALTLLDYPGFSRIWFDSLAGDDSEIIGPFDIRDGAEPGSGRSSCSLEHTPANPAAWAGDVEYVLNSRTQWESSQLGIDCELGDGMESVSTFPIFMGEKPFGRLCVASRSAGAFGRDEVLLLKEVATFLALYVERERRGLDDADGNVSSEEESSVGDETVWPELGFVVTERLEIVWAGPGARRFWSRDRAFFLGRPFATFVRPNDWQVLESAIDEGVTTSFVGESFNASLRSVQFDWELSPIDQAEGRYLLVGCFIPKQPVTGIAGPDAELIETVLEGVDISAFVLDGSGAIRFANSEARDRFGEVRTSSGQSFAHCLGVPDAFLTGPMVAVECTGRWRGELKLGNQRHNGIFDARWSRLSHFGKDRGMLVTLTSRQPTDTVTVGLMGNAELIGDGIGYCERLQSLAMPLVQAFEWLSAAPLDPVSQDMVALATDALSQMRTLLSGSRTSPQTKMRAQGIFDLGQALSAIDRAVSSSPERPGAAEFMCRSDLGYGVGEKEKFISALTDLCLVALDSDSDSGRISVYAGRPISNDEEDSAANVCIEISPFGRKYADFLRELMCCPRPIYLLEDEVEQNRLLTAFQAVKDMGGSFVLNSHAGEGSVVRISIPSQPRETIQPEGSVMDSFSTSRGEGEVLLVVDDELLIRNVCKLALEASGYTVIASSEGKQALDIYTEFGDKVSAVLLDLNMPGLGGMDTVRELLKRDPSAKVIATSGHFEEEDERELRALGITECLGKPFTIDAVLASLNRVLDRQAIPAERHV